MFKSAYLKIDRATEHVTQLNELFRKNRPFSYVLETNTKTGERATFSKENKPVIDRTALICAEAIHSLRVALDHAYWEIVSPFASSPKERRAVQFPFCERADRLNKTVKNRLANRVSQRFFNAIISLKPYGETGGNKLLYLIDRMDGAEKHRFSTPMADYTRLSSESIRHQVPDFPAVIGDVTVSQFTRDVVWRVSSIDRRQIGFIKPPTTNRAYPVNADTHYM